MSKKDPLKNFIAGGIGGACKTSPKTAFSGSYDCFMKTISSEGIPALYKGISVPMAMSVPFSAIFFGGCALGSFFFQGFFTSLVASPADRVKSILASPNRCREIRRPYRFVDERSRGWCFLSPWSIIGAGGATVAPHGKYPLGTRDVLKEIWYQGSAVDVSRTLFRGGCPCLFGFFLPVLPSS
uniref:Congested-like trachea protein n=1 Tax=Ditylenchus dipsaci TaxID=166011 RepID=A0A915DEY5_9BILA